MPQDNTNNLYNLPPNTNSMTADQVRQIVTQMLSVLTAPVTVATGYMQSGNFVSGTSGWQLTQNSAEINGTLNATSGYFGSPTNGVSISSTGLYITGSGFISTNVSPNARVWLVRTGSVGSADAIEAYNASNQLLYSTVASSSVSPTTRYFLYNHNAVSISVQSSSGAVTSIHKISDSLSTGYTYEAEITGTASRGTTAAAYYYNNTATQGIGFKANNTNSNFVGAYMYFASSTTERFVDAWYLNTGTSWSVNSRSMQITSDKYILNRQRHHISEFDETGAALASTVIAKLYWTGGGTSGTQTLVSDAASGYSNDDYTLMRLDTTSTASRSSSLTFNRQVDVLNNSRWESILKFNTGITAMTAYWGWYTDATHYAFFEFDTAVHATNIYFTYNNGGAGTRTATGQSMNSANFWLYGIQIYAGAYINAYINETLVFSVTSVSIPTVMKPYFYVDNKSSANSRGMDIDYFELWTGRLVTP